MVEITKIDSLDEVQDGTIIQAVCEDGVSRWGVLSRNAAGEAFVIPLDTEIPLGQRKPYTRKQQPPTGPEGAG